MRKFFKIPVIFIDRWLPLLKPSEFITLLYLTRLEVDNPELEISLTELAACTGFSSATTISSLKGLVRHGLLEKVTGTFDRLILTNKYKIRVKEVTR